MHTENSDTTLAEQLMQSFLQEELLSIPGTQLAELLSSRCYQALCDIHAVLDDETLDDAACFEKIEAIVEIFERLGSDGGSRHDF